MRSMARRGKSDKPGDVMHVCRDCKKDFKRPCDLTKHEKTHSRPWKCSEEKCKYFDLGWPTEKERDRLVNDKHSAAPHPYKCLYPPCTYASKRETNCKQHMEKAHGWEYVRSKSNGRKKATTTAGSERSPPTPLTPFLGTPQSANLAIPMTPFIPSPSVPLIGNFDYPDGFGTPPMNQRTRQSSTTRSVVRAAVQNTALELMADQLSVVSQKANEVDKLKITIEIMKNQIQRLEQAAEAPPVQQPQPQPPAHQFQSPREHSAHSAHSSHVVHSTPSTAPHINTPHPVQRPQSFHSHGSHSAVATPEVSQRAEPAQTQSGWVTVNASAKRTHPNGVDGPHDPVGQPVGSPKRPKMAALEPHAVYAHSQGHPHQQHVNENMDTDDSDAARVQTQPQTHSHSLPSSQVHSPESLLESTLPSQHMHAAFAPYGTQDGPSDDSWRPESQRTIEHRTPRGRGRGGGPGSRGGRGRKSLPAHVQLDDRQGVAESQTSPNGFYSPLGRSRGGTIRRGSGGGGGPMRGGRPPSSNDRPSSSSRAVSLGLQGVTAGKKTGTKPIRNADGVLIRKDGRPDMRSQSSAANLRKVHARRKKRRESRRRDALVCLIASENASPNESAGSVSSLFELNKTPD